MPARKKSPGYFTAMARYAEFSGRSTRSEFWWFTLVSGLLSFGAAGLDRYAGLTRAFYLLVALIHLIPSLAVFARRLHDSNRSGWQYLLLFTIVGAIPLLIFVLQRGTPGPNSYGPEDGSDPVPVTAPLPGAAPTAGEDPIKSLERLSELRNSGAISEAEYAAMKARVVGAPRIDSI